MSVTHSQTAYNCLLQNLNVCVCALGCVSVWYGVAWADGRTLYAVQKGNTQSLLEAKGETTTTLEKMQEKGWIAVETRLQVTLLLDKLNWTDDITVAKNLN